MTVIASSFRSRLGGTLPLLSRGSPCTSSPNSVVVFHERGRPGPGQLIQALTVNSGTPAERNRCASSPHETLSS
jgi:hypothetical protein